MLAMMCNGSSYAKEDSDKICKSMEKDPNSEWLLEKMDCYTPQNVI